MKTKVSFVCQECGYDSPQWLGKCPECRMWNSLREIQISPLRQGSGGASKIQNNIAPKRLNQIKFEKKLRLLTGFSELDSVLGGGIVRGSAVLLAGDPGVGKSTLLLQLALKISNNQGPVGLHPRPTSSLTSSRSGARRGAPAPPTLNSVLYISGEESEEQIKLRADRIYPSRGAGRLKTHSNFLLLSSTNTDLNCEIIQKTNPALVIIDSIQTMESENVSGLSGSVGQVRYAAFQFIKLAKNLRISIIMVGHVTKEGMVAGPMVLSHMVDTVLFLEGEKFTRTRILRSLKNRFGPIDEVGIFAIEDEGIKELNNPEQLFLSKNNDKSTTGSILSVTMEGTRPFLIEIQALVVSTKIPIPRRVASGIDYKRLELLLAVLQKHCNIPLGLMDVFVNVAGGIKLSDPAADLGICLAIISSFKNINLSKKVAISEVGLLGELREVNSLEKRTKEARKLGFRDIISSEKFGTLREVVNFISHEK